MLKRDRVSGSDCKNCRQPRNFQNLLVVSTNSFLADGRLQKLRGGGTRFSEKVKSYLTARFDVDTQTGRKPDLSEVATDMRTTRNTGSSRTFQRRMACERDKFNHSFPDCPQSAAKKGLTKAENVEIYGEGDLLSVLLREEIAFLIHERRDKEVEDIFNKMGVIAELSRARSVRAAEHHG